MIDFINRLLPRPKKVEKLIGPSITIKKNFVLQTEDFDAAEIFNSYLYDCLGFKLNVLAKAKNANIIFSFDKNKGKEEYSIETGPVIAVKAGGYRGLLYAGYTIIQLICLSKNSIPAINIEDKPSIRNRGFYQDVTRGKMHKKEFFKKMIDQCSFARINQMQFYVAHTYTFEGMQQVWFDKSPLTSNDIIELDAYAYKRGIELVPSIATFGHLYEVLRTQKYKDLCERENPDKMEYSFIDRMLMHTLNIFDNRSFELVKTMIDEYLPLFRSNIFNIGADETFDLCAHKNKNCKDKLGAYKDFVLKLVNHIKSKGKTVMMWDDIILKTDYIKDLPDDIIYLDWDYSAYPDPSLREKIAQKPLLGFCCGTNSWNRIIGDFETMFENINNMLNFAIKYKAKYFYLTNWGDFGDIPMVRLLQICFTYAGVVAWEGKGYDVISDYIKNFGMLFYNDMDVVRCIMPIAKYHIITYKELIYSLDSKYLVDHSMDKTIVEKSREVAEINYCKLNAIEEILYNKLPFYKDKDIILDLLNIIQGVRCFNKFDLQTYLYNGSFDELCEWYYDFCKAYRRDNEEGELSRNTEVIRKLMLRFRESKKTKS
ncbi:MAG: family 20 glycosylhydrolase [Christensenellaceae bacterium]|nr:family 20 glycosylhydrolase [Christensenellaceae bacterium]